jgi:hypothetical protein
MRASLVESTCKGREKGLKHICTVSKNSIMCIYHLETTAKYGAYLIFMRWKTLHSTILNITLCQFTLRKW